MPGRFQYAVIRYVPNVVRDEAVNVGVLVRDAERGDFAYRFLPRSVTVRRLWPDADRQLVTNFEKQLKQLKGSQQLKLTDRATGLPGVGHPLDRDFFARAREEFNGNLQLSMKRGIIAESLEEARTRAYGTYVAETASG